MHTTYPQHTVSRFPLWAKPLVAFGLIFTLATSLFAHPFTNPAHDGQKAFHRGDYRDSSLKFLEAEIAEPQTLEHAYNRAVSQYHEQNYEGAASGFAKAARSADKKLAEKSWFNLGNTLASMGDLQKAIEAYEQALSLNPANQAAQENKLWAEKKLREQQKQQHQKQADPQKQKDAQQKDQSESSPSAAKEAQPEPQQNAGQESNKESTASSTNPKPGEDRTASSSAMSPQESGHQKQESKNDEAGTQQDPAAKAENNNEDKKSETGADKQASRPDNPATSPAGEKASQANPTSETSSGSELRQGPPGQMSQEAALRLLRSLEDQDTYYGRPPQMPADVAPPEKDW